MPKVRDWHAEVEDDKGVRQEVEAHVETEEQYQDYLDEREEEYDYEDHWHVDYCQHGFEIGSGICGSTCTNCGHRCEDHYGDDCLAFERALDDAGCSCPGFSDKTNLDIMAESLDEKKIV